MSTFTFSYAYEALDHFSPTAKSIKKAVTDLNSQLEKTAMLSRNMNANSAAMGRNLRKAFVGANPSIAKSRILMRGLSDELDLATKNLHELQAAAANRINVRGDVRGVGAGVSGGGVGATREAPTKPTMAQRARGGMAGLMPSTAGLIATVGVTAGIYKAANAFSRFEDNLTAVERVVAPTAKELELLKRRSYELGAQFGQSSIEVLEAFKTISAFTGDLPAEELDKLTTSAMVLADAGQVSVVDAAKSISSAIGQWGKDANSATEFMNIMAAASNRGGSEITDTMGALAIAGTVAANSNISFAETNAALQAMAKVNILGRRAGTGLGATIQNLAVATQGGSLDISKRGLLPVLDALAEKTGDAAYMTKVFGKDHMKTGLALVANREMIRTMIPAIQGTNEAMEMSNLTSDDLNRAYAELSSVIESRVIKVLDLAKPSLHDTADAMKELFNDENASSMQAQADLLAGMAKAAYGLAWGLTKAAEGWAMIARHGGELAAEATTPRSMNLDNPAVQEDLTSGRLLKENYGAYSFLDKLLVPFVGLKEKPKAERIILEVKAAEGSTASVTGGGNGVTLDTGKNVVVK